VEVNAACKILIYQIQRLNLQAGTTSDIVSALSLSTAIALACSETKVE
jgi:hypothetical protein